LSKVQLFSVFGDPIIHSKSPVLWNSAFSGLKINARYFRIKCSDGKTVASLIREMGLVCCNLTAPLKERVLEYIDILDPVAKDIGAVNTIINKNGKLTGYNTDWIGVIETLKNNAADPSGKKVIVLGAGGAAKAAVFGLVKAKAGRITVINRTYDKAEHIAKKYNVSAASAADIYNELSDTDIIVSCVPDLDGLLDIKKVSNKVRVLCADYKENAPKRFISGTDWLLHQAAASFKLVFNEDPLALMRNGLKKTRTEKKKTKLSIIGFMGCGKTTVSQELSGKMNCKYIDTDEEITKMEKRSIPQIFNADGEDYFRACETKALIKSLRSGSKIISTGGGIILNNDNCELLKKTLRIWLWSDLEQIMQRIDISTRPLLNQERFYQRLPFYASNSDICVVNTGEPSKIAGSIVDEIDKTFKG
jgi:shikimate dehydrogenase